MRVFSSQMSIRVCCLGGSGGGVVAAWAPVAAAWTIATVGGVVAGVGLVAYGLWLADRG